MDDTGQVLSILDPNQNPGTTFSYQCSNSSPDLVTNTVNQVTTYGYHCNSGMIASVKDPNDSAAGRLGTTSSYEGVAGRVQNHWLSRWRTGELYLPVFDRSGYNSFGKPRSLPFVAVPVGYGLVTQYGLPFASYVVCVETPP
jgi:hypothetical protein